MSDSILFLAFCAAGALLVYLVLRGRRVGLLDLSIACAVAVPIDWVTWYLYTAFRTNNGWVGLFPFVGLVLALPLAIFVTLAAWLIAARLAHVALVGRSEDGTDTTHLSSFGVALHIASPAAVALLFGWGAAFLAIRAKRASGFTIPVPEDVLFLAVMGTFALFGVLDGATRIRQVLRGHKAEADPDPDTD